MNWIYKKKDSSSTDEKPFLYMVLMLKLSNKQQFAILWQWPFLVVDN